MCKRVCLGNDYWLLENKLLTKGGRDVKRPRILVTRKLPQDALDLLDAYGEVQVNPHDEILPREDLEEGIKDVEALLCLLTDTIDAPLLDKNPDLLMISNYAVGYNNIDIKACTERGIPVSNTPGVLTETTADFAWTLLMAAARRLVAADSYTRQGRFTSWGPMLFLGGDIYGQTLGVVGMGRIGKAVVERARGFQMRVIYYDIQRQSQAEEKRLGISYETFPQLLQEADFITLHVPLLQETRHLIGAQELRTMKKTAYLINTSRGPVVDEKALVSALQNGEIAGAGLDVFEDEPELAEGLVDLDNVTIAPHIASASIGTRTQMAIMAAENLLAGLKGEPIPNLINPAVFDKR